MTRETVDIIKWTRLLVQCCICDREWFETSIGVEEFAQKMLDKGWRYRRVSSPHGSITNRNEPDVRRGIVCPQCNKEDKS